MVGALRRYFEIEVALAAGGRGEVWLDHDQLGAAVWPRPAAWLTMGRRATPQIMRSLQPLSSARPMRREGARRCTACIAPMQRERAKMTSTTSRRWRVLAASFVLIALGGVASTRAAGRHRQQNAEQVLSRWTASSSMPGAVVQVTADRFGGHVEPDVAVDPRHPSNVLGACQFERGRRQRLPGTFASFDGGRTWRDNGLLPLPRGYEEGADTTVGFARDGRGYVVALMWHGGNGAASRVTRGGIFLWTTGNAGRSFSRPIPVYVGAGFQDHPWLAIRNTSRGAVLYLAWTNRTGLVFTHSRPGTTLFAPPRVLVPGNAPSTPVLVTDRRGDIEVFFQELHFRVRGGKLRPFPAKLAVVASRDDGITFGSAQTIASVTLAVGALGQEPPPLLGAASDPNAAVSAVAIAAQDRQAGHPVIELWRRDDTTGGWKGPTRPVTDADAALTQEEPRLVYANGHLYISYFTISRDGAIRERLVRSPEASMRLNRKFFPAGPSLRRGSSATTRRSRSPGTPATHYGTRHASDVSRSSPRDSASGADESDRFSSRWSSASPGRPKSGESLLQRCGRG